jgi:predicted O-linked N-acetylglucosamine transferase (SPINDLY family)
MPDHADALANRGTALSELGHLAEALQSFDRASKLRPKDASVLNNSGVVLQEARRLDEALLHYDRALAIDPSFAEALTNRGNLLRQLKRFDEALASYDRALAIKPDYASAIGSRANVLRELGRLGDALAGYNLALASDPSDANFFALRLSCKMTMCDWHGIGADFDGLAEMIDAGDKAFEPFTVVIAPVSAAHQMKSAATYVREKCPPNALLPKIQGGYGHDRIRLAYFSADFYNHATAHLIANLFERHSRDKFEVIAFSFGPPKRDAVRSRLEKAFDQFIDVEAVSDLGIALRARNLEIDIAVDLKGFTKDSRPGIFASRAAPVQVNYLGYPGTMGAEYIDYLIADRMLIPEDEKRHYSEKIVYLPHSYQVNDTSRVIADRSFTRGECGLPEQGFVFCCFNNSFKILPRVFETWMCLLKAVDGSVLWLLGDNPLAARNLRDEAQRQGVDPLRLVFAERMEAPAHLARHSVADLFLDTIPCNAHTTASDALWAGLPVITCLGETFAGRVAASLLNAVGLPQLIAPELGAYESLALDLAMNRHLLVSVRRALTANRLTSPLFDTECFTKKIESAYIAMWKRHSEGYAPEHLSISE